MIKRLCIALTLITLATPPSVTHAQWQPAIGRELMLKLSQCETGNNTGHLTRTYVGAFGFAKSTWRMFADTSPTWAHKLTWEQQARITERAFWFGYGKQYAVGPWGHGCFKRLWKVSSKLRTAVCNNRKQQVRRWCRL